VEFIGWTCLVSGKSYVGSATNLGKRLYNYYNAKYLMRDDYMIINRALLKYGYSNFILEILEYCEPSKCIDREQYYIDLLKPEYNILPTAGSSLGFKHSEETLAKMSGVNNPNFGKILSEETRAKIAAAKKGNLNAMFGKTKPEGAGKPTQRISVLDVVNNNTFEYDSMSAAARALDIKQSRISMYFARNQLQPYKGRYIFSKI